MYLFVFKNTHTYFVLIYIQEALSGCTGSDGCQCKQFVKVPYIQMTATLADTSANTIETWDGSLWKVRSIKSILI